jgi:hypothetical protein
LGIGAIGGELSWCGHMWKWPGSARPVQEKDNGACQVFWAWEGRKHWVFAL